MTEAVPRPVPFKYSAQQFRFMSQTAPRPVPFNMVVPSKIEQMAQLVASFRTTIPSTAATGTTATKQVNPVHVHQYTSRKAPLGHCAHVHK